MWGDPERSPDLRLRGRDVLLNLSALQPPVVFVRCFFKELKASDCSSTDGGRCMNSELRKWCWMKNYERTG